MKKHKTQNKVICFPVILPHYRKEFLFLILFSASLVFLQPKTSFANMASIGKAAPEFKTLDTQGKIHQLSDYKGKIIILEWSNPYCPYVRKHYQYGSLPHLQNQAETEGIIWLTLLSSAPGEPGYMDTQQVQQHFQTKYKNKAHAILMDESGEIGTRYGARTTPHIFIINSEGVLVYSGAIDDKPSIKPSSLKGAKNYILKTLSELKNGQPVSNPKTRAYGCSIHY